MTHQALTTYRALLDAAAVAPGKREDNPECLPARIVIPTGDRSSMTVGNTRERLQELAEHVRKHWTLYGGGPKPDDLKPKPRKASAWPIGLVRCWLGQMEDKDHAGAMLTAEQLGGWYALVGNTPDSHARGFVAPQHVEGMPERIVSACRDDGRWVVMDRVSGQTICNQKARSRANAEADALARLQDMAERRSTTPDAFLADALARVAPAADGLDQWRKRWGLLEVAPVAELAQPLPEVAPELAPTLDQVQPVPEVAPVLDQVQPAVAVVAPEVAPVADVAPAYALPENVFDDWRGAEGLAFVPSDRQRVVLQAVERALSEGLFYSTEIRARCAELLQPSDADKARGAKHTEGGYFGMDLYYARCSIKAQKRHREQAETLRALRPTVGDVYGVLVFNDYKVSRACKVEEVSDEGEIVLSLCRGARAGWRVTVSAVQIAYAMDRAKEKGARRGGWKDWIAAQPVPEVAPVAVVAPALDQVQPVLEVAPVLDQVQPVPVVAPVLDQVQPVPEVAPVLDQVQPLPDVAPVLDQAQPVPAVAPVAELAPVLDQVQPVPDDGPDFLRAAGFAETGPGPGEWVHPVSPLGDVIARIVGTPGAALRVEISADYMGRRFASRVAEGPAAIRAAVEWAAAGLHQARGRIRARIRARDAAGAGPGPGPWCSRLQTPGAAPPPVKPLQSTPPFRPSLSHWRNTQHARRRPAAGHSGPIRQPLQGAARTMAAGLGRPWAGLQQASTGPGKHGPGHGPGRAAGPGNRPGKGPGGGRHGRRAGAAPPPRAAGARLVQGAAAPGPGAPGRPPTCCGRPGRRAQAPPLGVAASADGVRGHSPPGVAASVHMHERGPPEPQDLERFHVPAFGVHFSPHSFPFSPCPFHFPAGAFRRILTRRLTHDHQAPTL